LLKLTENRFAVNFGSNGSVVLVVFVSLANSVLKSQLFSLKILT